MGQLHTRLLASAVDIGAGDLAELCEAARAHQVTIVCGLNERDRTGGGGTLYNSVVVIGSDGQVRNRHRKLMPTNPERMVHGLGDASGLDTARVAPSRRTLDVTGHYARTHIFELRVYRAPATSVRFVDG